MIAERLRAAHTHWTRLKGLLGTRTLETGNGLWIKPCKQVHMIGMRYAVDVVFLDKGNRVVHAISGLAPGKFSPKIKDARSVLELPTGTLARAGVAIGACIDIEGATDAAEASWIDAAGPLLGNVVLAALYTFFAAAHIAAARHSGRWVTNMPIVIQEALLVVLFLVRRRSIATSSRPFDWAVGILGAFLPMLLRPAEQVGSLNWIGEPLQILGVTLAVASLAFLGRSISLVAAHRGIKTAGMYRFVRHPIYASYMLSYLGYGASYPTLRNCSIVAISIAALTARAIAEERFLAQEDPSYRDYLRQVRWRFAPYIH